MGDLSQTVEQTASALVHSRKPFSAWDITKAISRLSQRERHSNVRPLVHDIFQRGAMSDYQRTLVQFPGGNGPAFLYHPPEVDPNDPNVVAGTASSSATLPAPATQDDRDDDDGDGDGSANCPYCPSGARTKTRTAANGDLIKVLGTSKGSTVYVPSKMADSLGLGKGNARMGFYPNMNQIKISAFETHKVCVDVNQNIRIGRTALMKAGIDGNVRIVMDGQQILISKE
jgi:hypothetical protein